MHRQRERIITATFDGFLGISGASVDIGVQIWRSNFSDPEHVPKSNVGIGQRKIRVV